MYGGAAAACTAERWGGRSSSSSTPGLAPGVLHLAPQFLSPHHLPPPSKFRWLVCAVAECLLDARWTVGKANIAPTSCCRRNSQKPRDSKDQPLGECNAVALPVRLCGPAETAHEDPIAQTARMLQRCHVCCYGASVEHCPQGTPEKFLIHLTQALVRKI